MKHNLQSKPPHLLLHDLIVALSYWGTSVRILLVGFVLAVATILVAVEGSTQGSASQYGAQFVYLVGSLLMLDAGYVTIARATPVAIEALDRFFFLVIMSLISAVAIFPYFVEVAPNIIVSVRWIFLVVLFVLTLRLVVGLFFGERAAKR